MNRSANRCAHAFLQQGVQRGTRSASCSPTALSIWIWWGSAKMGAVEVPINTSYKGEFLRHIIDQSDSTVLFLDHEYLDRLKLIEDDSKSSRRE